MRILYVNYGPQSGVTAAIASRFRAAGHHVEAFDPVDGFLYKRRLGPVQVPNLSPVALAASAAALARFGRDWRALYLHTPLAFDRLSARCVRAVARTRPDAVLQAGVLFAPGTGDAAPYYLLCDHTRALAEAYAPVEGLPAPIPFERGWRRREEQVYRGATGIFTMSEHVRRSLVVDYGVAPERVHVTGAGPNVTPDAVPDAAGGAPRAKVFLFVGKLFGPKGGPDALRAFELVRQQHPDAELWMVGGAQPATAPSGVRLLGPQPPQRVATLYARASAFVLPTLREAFGLAFLEAMSFGLPCIGTRIEAIPEIVADGATGLLVPPRAPRALAQAMLHLLDDPAAARAMGEAGRARARELFGWDRAVGRMLDVLTAAPAARDACILARGAS